jgi:hypothetical protein
MICDLLNLAEHPRVARPVWYYRDRLHVLEPGERHLHRTFVEVFSGCAELSKQFRKLGWIVHSIDISYGKHFDMTIQKNQIKIFKLIRAADYVHVALPCNTYSSALRGRTVLRTKGFPFGRPNLLPRQQVVVLHHHILFQFCIKIIKFCRRHLIPLSVENPAGSKLWGMPDMRSEAHDAKRNVCDFCAFGTPWRKRTCFLSWRATRLASLNDHRCKLRNGKCCFSECPHNILTGRGPGGKPWTRCAQDYPIKLCQRVAFAGDDYLDIKNTRVLMRCCR